MYTGNSTRAWELASALTLVFGERTLPQSQHQPGGGRAGSQAKPAGCTVGNATGDSGTSGTIHCKQAFHAIRQVLLKCSKPWLVVWFRPPPPPAFYNCRKTVVAQPFSTSFPSLPGLCQDSVFKKQETFWSQKQQHYLGCSETSEAKG